MMPDGYWRQTREPRYAVLFAMPLLFLYEGLARLLVGDQGIRNGADVLLKSLFVWLGGRHGLTVFAVVLLGTGAGLVARDWHRAGAPQFRYYLGMLVESALYALGFGSITAAITGLLLRGPAALALGQGTTLDLSTRLMVSLGAGIYEELLFRVVVVSLLFRLAGSGFGWRPLPAGLFATVLGALVFSGFHYLGPLGDRLELTSFVFRAVAGLLLSALFLVRGFGIAAWTHALSDIFLTLTGH